MNVFDRSRLAEGASIVESESAYWDLVLIPILTVLVFGTLSADCCRGERRHNASRIARAEAM
jgi:hypothetical protein